MTNGSRSTTQKVYLFVKKYIKQHTHPPSLREIAEACFLSTTSARRHLEKLERDGKLYREEGRARGITLVDDD